MFKKLLVTTLILWIFPHESSALIKNQYLGEITVNLEGAKRTKQRYMESLVEKCLKKGDYKSWETVDAEALRQCITNAKLFSKVEVQVNKSEIDIKILERWTLIPVPNFYASDGKSSDGMFVFESNFLGYGKTLGVGGSISTEGNSFSLLYLDPSVNFTNYTFRMRAYRSSSELDTYEGTTILYGYKKKEAGLFISPGYKVLPVLELSALLNYADKRFLQIASYKQPEDNISYSLGIRVSYLDSDYKLFYSDGISAQVIWLNQVHRSDDSNNIFQTTAKFEWDITLFKKHALQLGLNAGLQSNNEHSGDMMMYGRGKGFRGIQPNGLWTREIVAVSADYQIPLAQTGHGTFTIAPFVDYSVYKPFIAGTGSSYAAYGIGTYYFINLINLPGVGLVAGRNEDFMGTFIAFQIGMGFN